MKIHKLLIAFFLSGSLFAQYKTLKTRGQCHFQAGLYCHCEVTVSKIDDTDGPYHGMIVSSQYLYESCPSDVFDEFRSQYLADIQNNSDIEPYDYNQNISLDIPQSSMGQFWESTLASTVSQFFRSHSNSTTQSIVDSIRGWAPYNPQLAQDISNFRQEHVSNNGQVKANEEAIAKMMESLLQTLKDPDYTTPISFESRPTPIPDEVNKTIAQDYFNQLHKYAQNSESQKLLEQIQNKIDELDLMDEASKSFYQTELYRTYLNPDNTLKSLPLTPRPNVDFRTDKNSPIGKHLRHQLNQAMRIQSSLNSLLRANCLQGDCNSSQELLRVAKTVSVFNEIYTDIQRLDRAVTDWSDTSDYQDKTSYRLERELEELSRIKTTQDLDEYNLNRDEFSRDRDSSEIHNVTSEVVKDNNQYQSDEMKAAVDTININTCLTQYNECVESGRLGQYLNTDYGQGPQKEIYQLRASSQSVLKMKDSVESSNLYESHSEVYSLSQALYSTVGDSIAGADSESDSLVGYAQTFTDIALGLTPGVGMVKDLYEATTGVNLVTGVELEDWERAIAAASFVTLGVGSQVKTAGKYLMRMGSKLNQIGEITSIISASTLGTVSNIYDSARKLGLKAKNEISNFAQLSKQVLRADSNTFKHINKIAESAINVSPKLGDKYVKQLPDLTDSFKEAFEGTIHKGTYKPGEVLFQALRTGQDKPGRWFTPIKPIDADHAEELLNIEKWSNDAGQLRIFKVKESVSGYAGKVEGGSGHQFFIPNDVPLSDVIEEIILD